MSKINTIEDLTSVVLEKYNQLDDISESYLSEAGLAAKEAYRNILWYVGFYDSLKELGEDEEFQGLVTISGQHPEYYKVLRMVNRALERANRVNK